jgi:hypothetical protein
MALVSLLAVGLSTSATAQQEAYEGGLFENFGVGVKAGTYGFGLDFNTSLHPNIKARAGFSYFKFGHNIGMDMNVTPMEASQYGVEAKASIDKVTFGMIHGNLLFDFFPMRSGIFHFTAGLLLGSSEITTYGNVPLDLLGGFGLEDFAIRPNPDGSFDASLRMGNFVKPYLGIGLGRTITKRRVGFKFELGLVYQGGFKVESDYIDNSLTGRANEEVELELPSTAKFWPIMQLTLSYRIK